MLETSIFSFSRNVCNLPKTNLNFIVKFYLLPANALNLDQSKNLSLGKEVKIRFNTKCCRLILSWPNIILESCCQCLTLSQTINFRLFQTEKFVDNNFKFDKSCRKFSNRLENTVGKGDNAFLLSNFSFSHSVLKRLVLQTH